MGFCCFSSEAPEKQQPAVTAPKQVVNQAAAGGGASKAEDKAAATAAAPHPAAPQAQEGGGDVAAAAAEQKEEPLNSSSITVAVSKPLPNGALNPAGSSQMSESTHNKSGSANTNLADILRLNLGEVREVSHEQLAGTHGMCVRHQRQCCVRGTVCMLHLGRGCAQGRAGLSSGVTSSTPPPLKARGTRA